MTSGRVRGPGGTPVRVSEGSLGWWDGGSVAQVGGMIMIRRNASTMRRLTASRRGCGGGVAGCCWRAGRPHAVSGGAVVWLGLGEVAVEGEHLEPGGEPAATEVSRTHTWSMAYLRDGSRPSPLSLAALIRSSTRVAAMPGVQEGELSATGVGGRGLKAVAGGGLEQ